MNIDLAFWLSASLILFFVGLYGMVSQKDSIRLIISIEIMVAAANAVFIGIGHLLKPGEVDPLAQTYTILSLSVGGAIIAVALSIIRTTYDQTGRMSVDEWTELKW